ncbi:MAG: ABC transporter ATP-binding protein [Oscillospiraceae bacterium]|nr:ABC transporter ATP-binding protein [Oscillospiraceae bacterium]
MEYILEANNVCMDFHIGDGSVVHALKGINLQIQPNKLSVLRGRSGSGKTTLINILGALDRPTSGEVTFLTRDNDITKLPDPARDKLRRGDMAFVFQSVALISTMTAFENVEFALRLKKMPYRERAQRAKQALIQVGLEKRMHHRPGEMSGGEQQRVAIARAIATSPKIIFADEPTAELDSPTGFAVMKLFRELVKDNDLTIVMTTHDTSMMEVADIVYTLEDGVISDITENNVTDTEDSDA